MCEENSQQSNAHTKIIVGNKTVHKNRFPMLGLLMLIFIINMVDRQLIAVLSPAIKADLNLSDTQLGLLKGFAFILIYSFIGLPIAHLADRFSRVNIITSSLAVWSFFTLMCGFAQNFWHLLIGRFGFGIGAAGCTPAAHSLIANYFPTSERAIALTLYTLSIPIAQMLTFILGSWFTTHWGWRSTLIIFGVFGLLLTLFRFVVKEPKREIPQASAKHLNTITLRSGLSHLFSIPSLRILCLAAGLGAFGVSGLTSWVIDFFVRSERLNYNYISTAIGLAYGIFGCAGMVLGSYFAGRLAKFNTSYYLKLPGLALLTCVPILALALWLESISMVFSFISLTIFLMYSFQGTVFALIPSIVPENLRSRASAMLIFAMNMLGAGLGPLVVGVISDAFASITDTHTALRVGMSVLCIAFLASGYIFLLAAKNIKKDLQQQQTH